MAEAMLSSILSKGLSIPNNICVSDISVRRLKYLKEKYSVIVIESNKDAVADADIVILAVKPQNITEVIADLKGNLETNQLAISIVAGVKINTILKGLEHSRIVRVMPNTPAQIGYGMSAWMATVDVTEEQKRQIQSILRSMGKEVYFNNEKYLDMVTAVSASGPAYIFLLAESMIDAAVDIGLPHEKAKELVLQTILGAAHLMQASSEPPDVLRQSVTSRGGTTERALEVFERGGFSTLILRAIKVAYERAKELGG